MSERDDDQNRPQQDFERAVDRFQEAIEDLAKVASQRFSDRATRIVEDATARLRGELGRDPTFSTGDERVYHRRHRRRWRQRYGGFGSDFRVPLNGRRLARSMRDRKICGVCGGIARYFGTEPWVVRLAAITGLIFIPSVVFPAYIIACFIMPKDSDLARREARASGSDESMAEEPSEKGPGAASPRQRLRRARSILDRLETRLRNMETHVTSGRYDLQRELHRIAD
jgi:phage shock protein C